MFASVAIRLRESGSCRTLAWCAVVVLFGACTAMPPDGERMRVERIQQALLPMARTALDAGQTTTARRLYSRLLEADPTSASARMGLGDVALANRDPAQAATWYLAAVTHAEDPAERHAALLAHGRSALADADVEAAQQSFLRLTDPAEDASRPHAAWGFNGIGVIRLLEGKAAEAVVAMERAVLLDPDEPMFQANLARAARIAASYPVDPLTDRVAGSTPPPQREEPPTTTPIDDADVQTTAAPQAQEVRQPEPPEPSSLEAFTLGASNASRSAPESETASTDTPGPAAEPAPVPPTSPVANGGEQKRDAARPAPAALPPQPPTPPSGEAPPPIPEGAFIVRTEAGDYLQVGAYTVEIHAAETADALRDTTGLPVRVERALRDGRLLYRVHVGPVPPEGLPNLAGAFRVDNAVQSAGDATGATASEVPRVAVENGETYLEVAEYDDYARAEVLAQRLHTAIGRPVELSKVSRGGSPSVYRVRVGPLDDVPPTLMEETARIRATERRPR